MQGFENGVIQIESILIAAVVFVFLACAVVICTALTTAKILHSLPALKSIPAVAGKAVPLMVKEESTKLVDVEPKEPEAVTFDEQPGASPDMEEVDINEESFELPDAEPDDIDTTDFDESFMCEDDSYEYYEYPAV